MFIFSPTQVGLAAKEIEKIRIEGIPNNEDNFLDALKSGNSNQIFLLQMR